MPRFLSTMNGCLLALLAMAAAAQTARPAMPGQRQPAQLNAPANTPQVQAPATGAPAKPAVQQQPASRPPDSLSNTPALPPTVTYRDGLLTVQAQNSTLGAVLNAIRSKTGIEFDGLENSSDRVVLSQGPAPAGEVLSAIFAGSNFDFVAVGRTDNPSIVQRVIMTPKSGSGANAAAAQQPRPLQNAGQGGDDEDNSDDQANGGDPQDTPVQPVPVPQAQAPPQEQPQQPKTPEQLLQELQEMKKQQEQQQQGVTPNPSQVPRKQPPQ